MADYKKETNKVHKITLTSKIIDARWVQRIAPAGGKGRLEVWTQFIGDGSEIDIKVQDKGGKTIEKLSDKIYANHFAETITIPEKAKESLSFTAKLPKHGLEMKSGTLKVLPSIKVSNLKWGQKEARRGDMVKLSADIEGVPDDTEVIVHIYEHDEDGAHDFITKLPCRVKNKKIEIEWEYEYHEDTNEIPTDEEMNKFGRSYNPPEYFFVIDVYGKRFGERQESGLLEFRDWVEIKLNDEDGKPLLDEKYVLYLPDGSEKKGQLDSEGFAREADIPPGKVSLNFPNIERFQKHNAGKGNISSKKGKIEVFSGDKYHFETEPFIFSA